MFKRKKTVIPKGFTKVEANVTDPETEYLERDKEDPPDPTPEHDTDADQLGLMEGSPPVVSPTDPSYPTPSDQPQAHNVLDPEYDRLGQVVLPDSPDANAERIGQVDRSGAALRGARPTFDELPPGTVADPARIATRRIELSRQVAREMEPPTIDVESVRMYYTAQRDQLVEQCSAIEAFLGFTEHSDNLAVRIAKIELFLGLG
jgi:hypothetical protein